MDRSLRFAVIGASGFGSTCHIPGLQSHPNAHVVCVCSRREDRAKQAAERFNVPRWSTDWQAVISDDDIDAVTIATPDDLHVPIATAALNAGKHVFCEKPLGMNAEETSQLDMLARESGLINMVSFVLRYLTGTQMMRRQLRAGRIGRPIFFRTELSYWENWNETRKVGWRRISSRGGSGIAGDIGSHHFDQIAWIVGPVDQVVGRSVSLHLTGVDPETGGQVTGDTPDISVALVRAAGVPGILQLNSRATQDSGGRDFIEVIGETGALRAEFSRGNRDQLLWQRTDGGHELLPLPHDGETFDPPGLARMMKAFVNAIIRGAPDPEIDTTFANGHAAQVWVDALQK